ncbi:50S ribosomal protein L3 [Candidatus Gottesmanbacteria bacterium]|nr:50S ribosomal protein L3 [Candidatus Gottesmanbacteria bacterium]
MVNALLGSKTVQTQMFDEKGRRIPVTQILTGPCWIVGIKTTEKDGYNALQLGFGTRRTATLTKPELGNVKKAGLEKNPPRFFREVSISDPKDFDVLKLGTQIQVSDVLKPGDRVQVIGISKGKGFQGVVTRHHFKGGPRTHGQSDRERAPGSIGQTTTPGRVYKGKRMAGRMGSEKVTVKNLRVVSVDTQKHIVSIKGLIPGGRNALVIIEKTSE